MKRIMKPKQVFNHVLDLGTYDNLAYNEVFQFFESINQGWGGCSAIAKTLPNGDTVVGRNMDLNISNKPAFIVRTNVEGHLKTVGLSYFYTILPDYKDVLENGLEENLYNLIPFLCTDVLNEAGLYIETNMRTGECWPNGVSKFACYGTNPDSDRHVRVSILPRLLGEECKTVDEALAYVKTLNLYTEEGKPTAWNFCFLLADATGKYGILEVADDKVIWHNMQPCQTNFYLDETLAKKEDYKAGVGRYELLMTNIDSVKTQADMYDLIRKVSYYQIYTPHCPFDQRSEFVGSLPHYTTAYLLDEANRPEIEAYMKETGLKVTSKDRQTQQDINKYWESAFTELANCQKKTLFVRFFEDEERTLTLGFDD